MKTHNKSRVHRARTPWDKAAQKRNDKFNSAEYMKLWAEARSTAMLFAFIHGDYACTQLERTAARDEIVTRAIRAAIGN